MKSKEEFKALQDSLSKECFKVNGEEEVVKLIKQAQSFIFDYAGNLNVPSQAILKLDSLKEELQGNIRIDPNSIIGIKLDLSSVISNLEWLTEEEVSKMRYR